MNPAYRAQWVQAGYPSTMGSAEVTLPPRAEFVRVYHLTSAQHAVNDIGLSRIKVARFSDLNDPFELLAANFREARVRSAVRDFKNAYDAHTGLLCFSQDWTNPVLWSHYGEKHAGVCLGFNLLRTRAQTVRYEDQKILVALGDGEDPGVLSPELQNALLCTKYSHWAYENELRVHVPLEAAVREGQLHYSRFSHEIQLAEVILGPRCKLSLDAVRELVALRQPQAITFSARLNYKHFGVVPDEKTVP